MTDNTSSNNNSYAKELLSSLDISPLEDGRYILNAPFTVKLNNGDVIEVPEGYITNGADIPKIFHQIYNPYDGSTLPAVVIHDYLCDTAVNLLKNNKKELAKMFLYADEAFKEILTKLVIRNSKVNAFYTAVRTWHKVRY